MFSTYYWEDKGYKRLRMRKENSVQRPPSIYTLFPPCLVTMSNTGMSHKESHGTFYYLPFSGLCALRPSINFWSSLRLCCETCFINWSCVFWLWELPIRRNFSHSIPFMVMMKRLGDFSLIFPVWDNNGLMLFQPATVWWFIVWSSDGNAWSVRKDVTGPCTCPMGPGPWVFWNLI